MRRTVPENLLVLGKETADFADESQERDYFVTSRILAANATSGRRSWVRL